MLKIGIDASRAFKSKKTGTEWYAFNLLQNLKYTDSTNRYFLYTPKYAISDDFSETDNFEIKILNWPFKYIWTHIRLSWEMLTNPPDILFVPAHSVPLIHRKRTVVTIHDLGWLHQPSLYNLLARIYHRFSAWWSINKAVKIITISQFTRQDILNNYKISADKIEVIPLGVDGGRFMTIDDKRLIGQVLKKYSIFSKYFLYVGRLEKKKNTEFLLKSFLRFSEEFANFNLVLVGDLSKNNGILIDLVKSQEKIIHLGYVAANDLPILFNGAQAFVFPSLFEGFGLPVLEAMACGCPVISSNSTSLPEVGGKAVWYFDPGNSEQLIWMLKQIVNDNKARQKLIDLGRKRAKEFSWKQTAIHTKITLESICQK